MSTFKGPTVEEIFKRIKYQIKNEILYASDFAKVIIFFYKKNKLDYIEELVLDYARVPFEIFSLLQILSSRDVKTEVFKYVANVLARNDMEEFLKEFLFKEKGDEGDVDFKEIQEYIDELLRGWHI